MLNPIGKRLLLVGLLPLLSFWVCCEVEEKSFTKGELIANLCSPYVSAEFDKKGDLHVCAIDCDNQFEVTDQWPCWIQGRAVTCKIRYAVKSSGSWTPSVIDEVADANAGPVCSLDIDERDKVHIAYLVTEFLEDSPKAHIRFASNTSGIWQIEKIEYDSTDDDRQLACPVWLVLDAKNKPNIIFREEGGGIMLARKDASSWSFETTGFAENVFNFIVTADRSRNVHIVANVCRELWKPCQLLHIKKVDDEWKSYVIDASNDKIRSFWPCFSEDERLVSYVVKRKLRYAMNKGNSWSIERTGFEWVMNNDGTSIIAKEDDVYLAYIIKNSGSGYNRYKLYVSKCKEGDCKSFLGASVYYSTEASAIITDPLRSPLLISNPKGEIHLIYSDEDGIRHAEFDELIPEHDYNNYSGEIE